MKKILSLIVVVGMLLAVMTGCAGNTATTTTTKAAAGATTTAATGGALKELHVGFIYVGPVGDGGFTLAHDNGRVAMEKALANYNGYKVVTHFVENVPETEECETAMENLIKQYDCKVIFSTSFGFMDYTKTLAAKYPDVKFMHCSGYETADNMGNYFGRMYQARYLCGIAAGKATTTNKIGYVAAMKIPEVVRGIDAFTLGVRSVNPNATVQVVWTNTWIDPSMEKQAAESLLDAGCDVLTMHQDSTETVAAAEAAGKYSIAYHLSMKNVAPKGYLTGAIWDLGSYYTGVVKSVIDGTWKNESYWGSIKTGIVKLDEFGPSVKDETKQIIADKLAKIESGDWDVFWGPIKDQTGAVKVADGQKLTDADMLSIDWFVEGVQGDAK